MELFADELYRLADTVALPTDKFPEVNTEKCKFTYFLLRCTSGEYFVILCVGSEAYRQVKLIGYDLLEDGNKEIQRKLKPCPKAYKKYVVT